MPSASVWRLFDKWSERSHRFFFHLIFLAILLYGMDVCLYAAGMFICVQIFQFQTCTLEIYFQQEQWLFNIHAKALQNFNFNFNKQPSMSISKSNQNGNISRFRCDLHFYKLKHTYVCVPYSNSCVIPYFKTDRWMRNATHLLLTIAICSLHNTSNVKITAENEFFVNSK